MTRLPLRPMIALVIGFTLTNCTIVREQLRPTYDPLHVIPGSTRLEIEAELGSPEQIVEDDHGETTVYYVTSRVTDSGKSSMRDRMLAIDLFLFGYGELLSPFGLLNDERKRFTVHYDSQSIAQSITYYCLSYDGWYLTPNNPHIKKPTVTILGPSTAIGGTCNNAFDGL